VREKKRCTKSGAFDHISFSYFGYMSIVFDYANWNTLREKEESVKQMMLVIICQLCVLLTCQLYFIKIIGVGKGILFL
jgi:hypothetical protein